MRTFSYSVTSGRMRARTTIACLPDLLPSGRAAPKAPYDRSDNKGSNEHKTGRDQQLCERVHRDTPCGAQKCVGRA